MGTIKLATASGGSCVLSPTNTASDKTITVPAENGTMITNGRDTEFHCFKTDSVIKIN